MTKTAIGQIFIVNGQILTNNLAIWSHWIQMRKINGQKIIENKPRTVNRKVSAVPKGFGRKRIIRLLHLGNYSQYRGPKALSTYL